MNTKYVHVEAGGYARASTKRPGPVTETADAFTSFLHREYDEPEWHFWPEVRWWLNEGHHTDQTLEREIQNARELGFSAVEFLAMPDDGLVSVRPYYGWGSAEWINDSRLLLKKATEYGMGISLTSGTHWATANLPDSFVYEGEAYSPDHRAASKQIGHAWLTLAPGEALSGAALPKPELPPLVARLELQGVYVYRLHSGPWPDEPALHPGQFAVDAVPLVDLMNTDGAVDAAESTVTWTNDTGASVHVLALWLYGTGHNSVPSTSFNYTINYMDPYGTEAVKAYWEENILLPEVKSLIKENGRVELYMDSLEIGCAPYNNLWGYEMRPKFIQRYGYDPLPYLPFVRGGSRQAGFQTRYVPNTDGEKEYISKVRNDLFDLTTDMYIESVLKPLQAWLHGYGMKLRAEISYNQTFEISLPAKYVDDVETEDLDMEGQIDRYRGMAGGAHLYNRLFSCEIGALRSYNYRLSMDQYTDRLKANYASGINRNVLHGYASAVGSELVKWPGNEGMYPRFSGRFTDRDPASVHYGDWIRMQARYQKILRAGVPRRDIAIMRTDYQFDSQHPLAYPTQPQYTDKLHYWKDMALQSLGYTYDYFAPDNLLEPEVTCRAGLINPGGAAYRAVILYQEQISLESAELLLKYARDEGLVIVFANNCTEQVNARLTRTHRAACSRSLFNRNTDEEVQAVISQIKALPNSGTVDNQTLAAQVLQELGVYPRVMFGTANERVMPLVRETDNELYVYAYHYLNPYNYENTDTSPYNPEVSVEAPGRPYRYDPMTGAAEALPYTLKDGRAFFELSLKIGEAGIYVFNKADTASPHVCLTTADKAFIKDGAVYMTASRSGEYKALMSDGSAITKAITVPENIALDDWSLTVSHWTRGERKLAASEHRPEGWASDILGERNALAILGQVPSPAYTTEEYVWETLKNEIPVGKTELVPWKAIAAVGPHVSGVGTYETAFTLPDGWSAGNGAYLALENTNGGTAAVYVNGKKAPGIELRAKETDITELLLPGRVNTLKIEVTSTLANSIIGLYGAGDITYEGWYNGAPEPYGYGLTGKVTLVTYTTERCAPKSI